MLEQPRVALLVIGDGRDALRAETVTSFIAQAGGYELVTVIEVDDRAHELGFCGAVAHGWAQLRDHAKHFEYVFHLEEDWRFERPFDVGAMSRLLADVPRIAQVALRRGPVNDAELAAGGIVEMWPAEYTDREHDGSYYLEHALGFTTNPTLYRRALIYRDWPAAPRCEEVFGQELAREGCTFAYWGARTDAPWIEHTGKRVGVGY